MLLVKDSMTREVVTLAPQDTAKDALALCRERRIRHLPVVEDGGLVGIVSDRDLRSAAPAFGEAERVAALEGVRIGGRHGRGGRDGRPRGPHRAGGQRDAGKEDRVPPRRPRTVNSSAS